MAPHSIYLHIPFCHHRCGYCDFNTYSGMEGFIPAYVDALKLEILFAAEAAGEKLPVHTIFFGGGTPSLLDPSQVSIILDALAANFEIQEDAEVTLEANPGTVTLDKLCQYHDMGINRLSFGMQSVNQEELRLLEREHDSIDVLHAVNWSRQAGFENVNLDLIFGLPGQEMASWQRTLELALLLRPDHLSLYALTLEHGTPLHAWAAKGLVLEPDPDVAAEMYEWASDFLNSAGFAQYEISNWSKHSPDDHNLNCAHNLQYWRNLPYLGFGAGAHGYANGVRVANVLGPSAYIQRLREGKAQTFPLTPATSTKLIISREEEIGETMMMGLRLVQEGVSGEVFFNRFGERLEERYTGPITRFIRLGLLEWAGDALRLTKKGRLLGNRVFSEFI